MTLRLIMKMLILYHMLWVHQLLLYVHYNVVYKYMLLRRIYQYYLLHDYTNWQLYYLQGWPTYYY